MPIKTFLKGWNIDTQIYMVAYAWLGSINLQSYEGGVAGFLLAVVGILFTGVTTYVGKLGEYKKNQAEAESIRAKTQREREEHEFSMQQKRDLHEMEMMRQKQAITTQN